MNEIKILCLCGKEFVKYSPTGITVRCPYCKRQRPNPLKLNEYKEWMSKRNREQYHRHAVKREKKRRERIQIRMAKWYGTECNQCGSGRDLAYHHIDPQNKLFNIRNAIDTPNKYSDEQMECEIKKCVLLCRSCHTTLHNNARSLKRSVKDQYIMDVKSWMKKVLMPI